MPIPKEILSVPRPVNTIVIMYGKDKDRFAVRQRIGCKCVEGRNVPVNGPTIGHIRDGVFVPLERTATVTSSGIDLKDWADVILCDRLFSPVREELEEVYAKSDATRIYCISLLRVCNPGIKDCELKEAYETGFLSELYPDVALSRNTVSKFLGDLGKTCSRITAFMRSRAERTGIDHHVLIDGTLKSDESKVNSLSDFSRKAKAKGTRDISVLYAFDLERMEPICSKCFPGNMLDLTSYESFIRENNITKGIIVADKGFPSSAASDHFGKNPDLHYLNPLRRNLKIIDELHMMDFTGILPGFEGVTYRKEKSGGKWLYSYRDAYRAGKEERDYLKRAKSKDKYRHGEFLEKQKVSGTVVLESDLDLTPEAAYKTYGKRWEIELVMRFYKSACEFDETRVHDDYSVIGTEFCDFLASVLTYRLINAFDKKSLLNDFTYKKLMSVLKRGKKVKGESGEWELIKMNPSHEKILTTLGLLEAPPVPPKRKPGRPKKVKI
jgi:hypothetical protein